MFALTFLAGTYFCGWLEQSQNSQKLEVAKILCTRLSKLCNPNPLYPPPRPLTEKLSISKHYQEPITRSEQLPCVRVAVCSRTSLFLERFWHEFWNLLNSTNQWANPTDPKMIFFCLIITFSFPFWYLILRMHS